MPSPLFNINTKPDHQRRRRTNRKQEREPLPIILRLVNDRLDDVRPHHRGSAVGKTKEAKELCARVSVTSRWRRQKVYHVVEPGWTELSHHRLRKGIVWCLEETE